MPKKTAAPTVRTSALQNSVHGIDPKCEADNANSISASTVTVKSPKLRKTIKPSWRDDDRPTRYALNIGKLISLELTAIEHGFVFVDDADVDDGGAE
jgi:hypothetical protein